jgi:hypothetical protein
MVIRGLGLVEMAGVTIIFINKDEEQLIIRF